jgi:hypothetical protein
MDGGAWILRDNTGLKGLAADFARAQLEDAVLSTSDAGRVVTKIDTSGGADAERDMYRAHLPGCSHLVQAVGFTRDPVPELSRGGWPLTMRPGGSRDEEEDGEVLEFDHVSGGFRDAKGRAVRGLFGAGIAFPEKVVDPLGNVEFAVGFWKFMKFLKRVVPEWTGR